MEIKCVKYDHSLRHCWNCGTVPYSVWGKVGDSLGWAVTAWTDIGLACSHWCFSCNCHHQRVTSRHFICNKFNRVDLDGRAVLRRGSSAACLLRLRVRIPPGSWISVSCKCCVLQVDVSPTGRSPVQRSPTECGCALLSVVRCNSKRLHRQ